MRKRMIQLVFAILGISIGYSFLPPLWESLRVGNHLLQSPVINSFIGLLVTLILAVFLVDPIENIIKKFEKRRVLFDRKQHSLPPVNAPFYL